MDSALRSYPDYKSSGAQWLGEIPAHWELRRMKISVANIINQPSQSNEHELCLALEDVESGTGLYNDTGPRTKLDSQVKQFRADDVLFGKLRPYLAKVVRPAKAGTCVSEFLVLRPRDRGLSASYLEQLLRSKPIIDAINSSTFGAKMPRADWQFISNLPQPVPPLPEQTTIVRYLNHATELIHHYISAKEQIINLLEEQRQAVIQRAVTRGLDPNVYLKPSGVEWLGEIPTHWKVMRLRYLIKRKLTYGANSAAEYTNPDWPRYLRITDFNRNGALKNNTFRSLPPEMAKDHLVRPEDILLARSGATVGKSFLVPADVGQACYAGYLIRACPDPALIQSHFLFTFTQSSSFARWKNSTFILSTIQNISAEKYANLDVPCPPLSEQTQIIHYIKKETNDISTTINCTLREIELLKEYRTRLIADVVTGKLDVREAAFKLPEMADELSITDKPGLQPG